MAMDKINSSPLTQPNLLDRFKVGGKGKEGSEQAPGVHTRAQDGPPPADTAEISDTAHQLMDLRATVDIGRLAIQNEPDVRAEQVAMAKKRLEQGYYNSQKVQDEVAGILSNVFTKMDEL